MEPGPTEFDTGRSRFLLSCGCNRSRYYRVAHGAGPIPNETQFRCRTIGACRGGGGACVRSGGRPLRESDRGPERNRAWPSFARVRRIGGCRAYTRGARRATVAKGHVCMGFDGFCSPIPQRPHADSAGEGPRKASPPGGGGGRGSRLGRPKAMNARFTDPGHRFVTVSGAERGGPGQGPWARPMGRRPSGPHAPQAPTVGLGTRGPRGRPHTRR